MNTAKFKELCLDTDSDSEALGRFWAQASGGRFAPEGTTGDVAGQQRHQSIAICRVPEAKTVKHRVHLDIYTDSIARLTDLGAQMLLPAGESGFGWTVMADPDGGEFDAFLKEPMPAYRVHGIGVDSVDPAAIAAWWGEVYGVEPRTWDGYDYVTLEHTTPDPVLTMDFAPVPEPKTVKNRLHWDVYGDPADLLARGATHLWDTEWWSVLADPEGNEFCVFPPH